MPEERKLVTILFADIVGSTSMTAQHDAEVVRAALDRAFDRIAPVVVAHGGTVEKFIGDAVMAVFGMPAAHDDDAERAVRAAFQAREIVRQSKGRIALDVRIGINTGEVVARTDAADQRLVTGVAVNLAQRLQSAAEAGELLVGELTQSLTRSAVQYSAPRRVQAKGIGEVSAWAAEALLDVVPEQHRGIAGLRARLIGRDSETRLLQEALRRTRETGAPHLITVYGPPGAGKSRLVAEFTSGVGDVLVRVGRCLPYGDGITFYPLQLVLRQDAGIELSESREDAIAKLRATVLEAVDAAEADAVARRVIVLAGLGTAEEVLADVPREDLGDELRWGIQRYFERRAAREPLVLVFEDIHWGELAFLDLVEHLAEWARAPLCLICLARPDFRESRPTWGSSAPNATSVALAPLSSEDTRRLIAELLAIDDLPEDVRAEVVSRAEGNPLYVEEFLRMLMESGAIEQRDGRWVAVAGAPRIDVPPTLTGLITARLDRVGPDVRRLLQRGSLAGRVFSTATLAALSDDDAPKAEHLRDAVRRDLLIEVDERAIGGGRVFRFKHALIREVVYGTLSKAERARLHDRYGRWIEASMAERRSEVVDVVAFHAEQAFVLAHELGADDAPALGERALELLLVAGRAADDRDDETGARGIFLRAASVADSLGQATPAAVEARGRAAGALFLLDPAEHSARFEAALAAARTAGPSSTLALMLLIKGGRLANDLGELEAGLALSAESLAAARAVGDHDATVMALSAPAMVAYWGGRMEEATERFGEALAYADAHGVERWRPEVPLSLVELERGDLTSVMERRRRRANYMEARGSRVSKAQGFLILGLAEIWLGDYDSAAAHAKESYEIRSAIGLSAPGAAWHSGQALLRAGRPSEALPYLEKAIERWERIGNRGQLPMVQALAAQARARTGDLAHAHRDAQNALRNAFPWDIYAQAFARVAVAEVARADGDLGTARTRLDEALAILAPTGYGAVRAEVRIALAELLLSEGRREEARSVLEAVRDFYHDPIAYRKRAEVDALLAKCDAPVTT